MSKNEIRLRKQMSSGKIRHYRNYSALMHRHQRDKMIKRAGHLLLYFFIVIMILIISFMAVQHVRNQQLKNPEKKARNS